MTKKRPIENFGGHWTTPGPPWLSTAMFEHQLSTAL